MQGHVDPAQAAIVQQRWRLVLVHPVRVGGLIVTAVELTEPQEQAARRRDMPVPTFCRHWRAALRFLGVPDDGFTWFSRYQAWNLGPAHVDTTRELVVVTATRMFLRIVQNNEGVAFATRSRSSSRESEADERSVDSDATIDASSPPASSVLSGREVMYD